MACQDLILPNQPLLLRHRKWLAPAEVNIGLRQIFLHDDAHETTAKPISTRTSAHIPSHTIVPAQPLNRGSKARYNVRFVDGAQPPPKRQHEDGCVPRRVSAQRQCLCRSGLHKQPPSKRRPPRSRARDTLVNGHRTTDHGLSSIPALPQPVPRTSYAFCGIGMPVRQTSNIHYLLHSCEFPLIVRQVLVLHDAYRLYRCTEYG